MSVTRNVFLFACVATVMCAIFYIQSEQSIATEDLKATAEAGAPHYSQVLKNIQSLKAFSIGAYKNAKRLKRGSASMKNSVLCNLILKLGKVSKANLVSEYAKAVGELKGENPSGINYYIINHLDHAVQMGSGIVSIQKLSAEMGSFGTKYGDYAVLSKSLLGLQGQPMILLKLAPRYSAFASIKVKIDAASSDADHNAAAAWLASGAKKKFANFAEQIHNTWEQKREKHEGMLSEASMTAEIKKFNTDKGKGKKKNELVIPQPIVSMETARTLNNKHPLNTPSEKKIKKMAKAKAQGWASDAAKGLNSLKVVKREEETEAMRIKKGKELMKKQKIAAKMTAAQKEEKKNKSATQKLLAGALKMVHNREMAKKEKHQKKEERKAKEKAFKAEVKAKEVAKKEKAAKAKKERRDKKLEKAEKKRQRERAAKAEAAQKRAEKAQKEANSKEFASKAAAERSSKAAEQRTKKAEKEVKYKRVITQCSTTRYWDGQCTLCPAHWYTSRHCPSGGSLVGEKGCGFMNAGCLGLCARQDCRQVRVRL